MQYAAYQNCMMSSCCWVMLCTTRRVVYSSPCVDTMVSLIKISQYHVSRDMPVCPFCTKFCIHPYSKSHTKHQTHCCPWHILPWRTWIKEIPRTQSLVISILSCKPLQWHSVSFAAICGLCEKEKRCSFRVVRQSKVWIHAFLMLILHTISNTVYVICIYIPHTSNIYTYVLVSVYFWVWPPPSSSGKWRFIGIPKPKHVIILVVTVPGRGPHIYIHNDLIPSQPHLGSFQLPNGRSGLVRFRPSSKPRTNEVNAASLACPFTAVKLEEDDTRWYKTNT